MRAFVRTVSIAVVMVLVAVVPTASSSANQPAPEHNGRVLLFVSDGMRQDLMERYAGLGLMPTYAQVLHGSVDDRGAIPPPTANSAPGWVSIMTGANQPVSGILNNTFHDNTLPVQPFGVSGFSPANNRAETIARRAFLEGKKVAALGVVTFDPTSISPDATNNVVVEYFPDWLAARGIIANFPVPLQNTHLLALGPFLTSTTVTPAPASGWSNLPPSFSPAQETSFSQGTVTHQVLIYDSTDDATVNYDKVLVSPTKDAALQVAILGAGELSDSIPATVGGLAGGFYVKVIDLTPDLSRFRLFFSQITRVRAYPASLEDELVANFDSVPPEDDFVPYLIGIIDAATHTELRVRATDVFSGQLYPFILDRYQPDLALVGNQATDAIQHRFLGLATPGSDTFDPATAPLYEGFIRAAYQSSDRSLSRVWAEMPDANVFVTSDHGFSSSSQAININFILQQLGLFNPASPGTSQAFGYGQGGAANIYINLQGRNPGGVVPPDQYDAVQDTIENTFRALGSDVIEHVFEKSETSSIFVAQGVRLNMLDPNRTGDVVVFSKPPYQFDAPTAGQALSVAPINGQHGYLPNGDPERYAVFAAVGPDISGKKPHKTTLFDIAPTVAAVLGITPPANATGEVLDILEGTHGNGNHNGWKK